MRAVFMGTPDFAAAALGHVLASDACQVVGVYCQPDRPCGRGQKCRPSAVKRLALERDLPVFQPLNFKNQESVEELRSLAPDVLLVAAYGLILPQAVLDVPTLMPVNVHASLLPKYRGAAPIQRCLLAGDKVTGVTIMRMVLELDAGPMLLQRALVVGDEDDAGALHDQLSDLGGRLLTEALQKLRDGLLKEIQQDNDKATFAPKIEKTEAEICWERPAAQVHNQIRAFSPKPGAHFFWRPDPLKAPLRIQAFPGKVGGPLPEGVKPGVILGLTQGALAVACADAMYLIPRLQPSGKREQSAEAFACGYLNKCAEPELAACGPDVLAASQDTPPEKG